MRPLARTQRYTFAHSRFMQFLRVTLISTTHADWHGFLSPCTGPLGNRHHAIFRETGSPLKQAQCSPQRGLTAARGRHGSPWSGSYIKADRRSFLVIDAPARAGGSPVCTPMLESGPLLTAGRPLPGLQPAWKALSSPEPALWTQHAEVGLFGSSHVAMGPETRKINDVYKPF